MTKTNVIQILALLQTAFPNTRIDGEATLNLWYSLYHDVDFEVAKKATELIIRTNGFFPTHKDFGKALAVCNSEIIKSPIALPKESNKTIQEKIQNIIDMWESGELDNL